MTLVSGGGFIPSDGQSYFIKFSKFTVLALIFSMLNFFLIFNIFNKKTLLKDHLEDFIY